MLDACKYIITNEGPVMFSSAMVHADVARGIGRDVLGAGFAQFYVDGDQEDDDTISVRCYGESLSLGVKSRGEEDAAIIRRTMLQ